MRSEFIEYIRQQRNLESRELIERQIADSSATGGCAVDRIIVNDYQTAIAATTNVEFDAAGAAEQGFLE